MEKMMWHLNDLLGMCHVVQMAMMECVGQVNILYALPTSFSCLTATTPSSHRNTHCHITPHPLPPLVLMTTPDNSNTMMMETGGQQ